MENPHLFYIVFSQKEHFRPKIVSVRLSFEELISSSVRSTMFNDVRLQMGSFLVLPDKNDGS